MAPRQQGSSSTSAAPRGRCAALADARAQAASAAASESVLIPSAPHPPLSERTAAWSGWDPEAFERLAAMNPLSMGLAEAASLAVRQAVPGCDLPTFSRNWVHPALLQALRVVDVAHEPQHRQGQLVRVLEQEAFVLLHDVRV